ncbi:hypothetical protein K1719_035602 [Acacia pycnantha]|nr:hypothetical protein K1719_035602 [Acacia pycnantha]
MERVVGEDAGGVVESGKEAGRGLLGPTAALGDIFDSRHGGGAGQGCGLGLGQRFRSTIATPTTLNFEIEGRVRIRRSSLATRVHGSRSSLHRQIALRFIAIAAHLCHQFTADLTRVRWFFILWVFSHRIFRQFSVYVRWREPDLVALAKPKPREMKLLSDIDDQEGLRFQIPMIHFYHHKSSMKGKVAAQVIKKALSQALLFYYPFAGVIFVEADADTTLQQFGDTLQLPFPHFDELLYKVPGSEGVINCPLLIIQVTRLK